MSSLNDTNSRFEDLEMKITFQDEVIEQLNQSIIRQQNDIVLLTKMIEKMSHQMQDMQTPSGNGQQAQELPPHY